MAASARRASLTATIGSSRPRRTSSRRSPAVSRCCPRSRRGSRGQGLGWTARYDAGRATDHRADTGGRRYGCRRGVLRTRLLPRPGDGPDRARPGAGEDDGVPHSAVQAGPFRRHVRPGRGYAARITTGESAANQALAPRCNLFVGTGSVYHESLLSGSHTVSRHWFSSFAGLDGEAA